MWLILPLPILAETKVRLKLHSSHLALKLNDQVELKVSPFRRKVRLGITMQF